MLFILMALPLLIVAVALHKFKAYSIIAGFNTMREEEKQNVEIEKVAKVMYLTFYIIFAITVLLGVLSMIVDIPYLTIIWVGVLMIGVVTLIILSQKYDHNERKNQNIIITMVVIISVLLPVLIIVPGLRGTSFETTDDGLDISGMYGSFYQWEDIKDVYLDDFPEVTYRSNGSKINRTYKGNFETTEFGNIKLFINDDRHQVIVLVLSDSIVIINEDSEEATLELFETIKNR